MYNHYGHCGAHWIVVKLIEDWTEKMGIEPDSVLIWSLCQNLGNFAYLWVYSILLIYLVHCISKLSSQILMNNHSIDLLEIY